MSQWITFLRAINVGGRNVKMEELKEIFLAMGFCEVSTFIASGNVFFEARAGKASSFEEKIERSLQEALGYEVSAFVRDLTEVEAIGRNHSIIRKKAPWKIEALNVGFLKEALSKEKMTLLKTLETDIDIFELKGRELYWLCRKKQSESKCSNVFLERKLGVKMTFRGMATVERLSETLKN